MCKIREMNLETAKYYGYEAQGIKEPHLLQGIKEPHLLVILLV